VALLLVVTVTGGITSEFEVFEDGGEVNLSKERLVRREMYEGTM
jgi:hypothetical protein